MLHESNLSKTAIRFLFTAVALGGALQYGLCQKFGEPYPSLMMPSFAGAGGYQHGQVRLRSFTALFITPSGEAVAVLPRQLLNDFPDSYHTVIAQSFLSPLPDGAASSRAPHPCQGLCGRLFPGLRAGLGDRTGADNLASLRAWLVQRAHTLMPGRAVDRVEFRWYEDTLQHTSGHFVRRRQPAGVFVVRLTGEPR